MVVTGWVIVTLAGNVTVMGNVVKFPVGTRVDVTKVGDA